MNISPDTEEGSLIVLVTTGKDIGHSKDEYVVCEDMKDARLTYDQAVEDGALIVSIVAVVKSTDYPAATTPQAS